MLRLQRYLLAELLASFALVLLLVTGIFLAASLLQVLHRFPSLSVLALLESTPLFLGMALPVTTPLAFLIACLLSYGRFADDNEFLAFQMGGISPRHAAAPAICAAACISLGTVGLLCDVNPILRGTMKSVMRGQVKEQVERMRSSGATNVRLENMEMSWKDRDGEWYRDVFLTYTTEVTPADGGEKVKTTRQARADRAQVKLTDETPMRLKVTLVGGRIPGTNDTVEVGKQDVYIDLDDERHDTKSKDEMRASELYYRMARLEPLLGRVHESPEWDSWRKYAGEYWRRVAIGLAPLALALLGVPLGLIARRGSRAQALVLALFVALPVYYPLLLWGDALSRSGVLPPALGLNLSNLVVATAGVVLLYRVVTR